MRHVLPTFINGIPLSATDLNQIGQEQHYIWGVHRHMNFAQEEIRAGWVRYLFHHYRYLRWFTDNTSAGAHLYINGVDAGLVAASATSGVIDLGNGYGVYVDNPYFLTARRPYRIEWEGDNVPVVLGTYEHPTSSGSWSLPSAMPTFTTGANADQLNAIAAGTKYLLENAAFAPQSSFAFRAYSPSEDRDIDYRVYHKHRFLHFYAIWRPKGESGLNYGIQVKVNGSTIWSHAPNGASDYTYAWCYDLTNKTDHVNYSSLGTFSNPSITLVPTYRVAIHFERTRHTSVWESKCIGEHPLNLSMFG